MDDSKKEYFDDVTKRMTEEILKTVPKAMKDRTEENTADTSNDNLMDDINECKPDKHQLLAKYLDKPVKAFRQYDCFTDAGPDPYLDQDKDDHYLFAVDITYELMRDGSVRVLIEPEE